jgi:UDP-glucuronate 4-epimerase
MRILVTGAAGFIGSHLSERLLHDGHTVIGVDNFDDFYDPQIKRRNIGNCLNGTEFQLVEADIRDGEAMNEAIGRGVEVIVHLAAKAGVRPSIAQPLICSDVNINGTMILLELAKDRGIDKFVFASSSSVYGNNEKVPFSEEDNVDFPISPYAATKKAGELICHTYHHLCGMSVTCLRFFTVYGPRQRPDLAIHKFARLIERGEPIPVYGDGSAMRDFTYIDDVVDGTVAAIDKCAGFNIYNLGESQPVEVNELIAEIEHALARKAVRQYLPPQAGDVERTYADVTRAGRDLAYHPGTNLRSGLASFVEWLRRQP